MQMPFLEIYHRTTEVIGRTIQQLYLKFNFAFLKMWDFPEPSMAVGAWASERTNNLQTQLYISLHNLFHCGVSGSSKSALLLRNNLIAGALDHILAWYTTRVLCLLPPAQPAGTFWKDCTPCLVSGRG